VRLGRLVDQTRRLDTYYHAHSNPILYQAPSTNPEATIPSLFGRTTVRSGLTTLPPAPFLVPAVLEALKDSGQYKDITEVVPGEADLYCAKYLNRHGGTVLTGDSDLLVHDIGLGGAVGFFKEIQGSSGAFHGEIYHPAAIADRLGLPKSHKLHSLAFEMFMDHHGTFPQLLARAKNLEAIKSYGSIFEDFLKGYVTLPSDTNSSGPRSAEILLVLRQLDPRISEYVLQFPSLAEIAAQSPAPHAIESFAAHVFLPFLLDCPIRTNAWEMSTATRQLAYGLINLIVPESEQKFSVFEHRKQQDKSSGRELELPATSDIPHACTAIVKLIDQLKESIPQLSTADLWTALAVYQDVEWSRANAKDILSRAVTQRLFELEDKTSPQQRFTWDVIQFFAQIQASYYSFRILKQIASLLVSHNSLGGRQEPITLLYQRLASLPSLNLVEHIGHIPSIIRRIEHTRTLAVAYEMLGIGDQPKSPQHSGKKTKKKRKRDPSVPDPSACRARSNNPFELLVVE
jgi:hypothetical protein